MKQIINGKLYDTEKSDHIVRQGPNSLYLTKKGTWFECVGTSAGSILALISPEEAFNWLHESGNADKAEEFADSLPTDIEEE